MRRSVLAESVRSVIETLEARTLLSASPVLVASAETTAPPAVLASAQSVRPAGVVGTGGATITGNAFFDINLDGIQELGEGDIAGQTVFLDTNQNGLLDPGEPTDVTDLFGKYSFTAVANGTYHVVTVPFNGFHVNAPGFVLATADVNPTNLPENNYAVVTGTVFNDNVLTNGHQDPGEAGIAGRTVFLDLNNNGVYDAPPVLSNFLPQPIIGPGGFPIFIPPTTGNGATAGTGDISSVTDANGTFTLTNVPPGTYNLRIIVPTADTLTGPPGGSYRITIPPSGTIINQNFGMVGPDFTAQILKVDTRPGFASKERIATVRVTNVSAFTAVGQVGVTLWASADQTLSPTSDFIMGFTGGKKSLTIKPGQSKVIKVRYAFPTTLPSGRYFTIAQVVTPIGDVVTTNDTQTFPTVTPVTQPTIDLALTFAGQPLQNVLIGATTGIQLLVNNLGTITATGRLTFHVYSSPDPALEPDASFLLTSKGFKTSIKPHKPRLFTLTIPNAGAPRGMRFYVVTIEGISNFTETSTANNVAISTFPTFFQ